LLNQFNFATPEAVHHTLRFGIVFDSGNHHDWLHAVRIDCIYCLYHPFKRHERGMKHVRTDLHFDNPATFEIPGHLVGRFGGGCPMPVCHDYPVDPAVFAAIKNSEHLIAVQGNLSASQGDELDVGACRQWDHVQSVLQRDLVFPAWTGVNAAV
jgi:hypothetical protein